MTKTGLTLAFLAALSVAGLGLAGCGFAPLYGENGAVAAPLATIYVEPLRGGNGYVLRNELIDLLRSDGQSANKAYRLAMTLRATNRGLALQSDSAITRYNDTLAVEYTLTDRDGHVLASGNEIGPAAYNVVTSPYATQAARQDADARAARDIAERIRLRLAAYFAQGNRAAAR